MDMFSGGSGSGMDLNVTAQFSCRSSNLSSTNITNATFWAIDDSNAAGSIFSGVIILIYFIVGVVWNIFIVITYLFKYKLLKDPGNIFLFNMAITDIVICVTTMMFIFVTAFMGSFQFGSSDETRCIACKVSSFFLDYTILVTFHLLCAISVDRFLHLSKPLTYSKIMDCKRAIAICIFIYVLCFVLAIPPLVGFGEIEFNSRFAACVPRFSPFKNLIYVVIVAIEVCIPFSILTITGFLTFRLIRVFLKKNFRRRSLYKKRGSEREDQRNENSRHQKQQIQLVKVFTAFYIAIIVSYTPVMIMIFIVLGLQISGSPPPHRAIYIVAFLCFLTNPVIHPIVESFFVKDLRYQVTRAKKGIRRASTIIYRQTTQLMNNKALDEANRKLEAEEREKQKSLSKNGTSGHQNGKPPESMVTEMETINSRSASPQESIGGTGEERKRATRQSVTFQESILSEEVQNYPHSTSTSSLTKSPKSPSKSILNGGKGMFSTSANKSTPIAEEPDRVAGKIQTESS